MNTFEHHKATPNVSLDQHVKSRIVALGKSIDGRVRIYLDTKFWVILRKASTGVPVDAGSGELLTLLHSLVAQGKVICPISESVFLELLKQSDDASRLATAKLIDDLSLGVTLLTMQARAATEVARFIHAQHGGALHPLTHLVWTKLSYVLGFVHPSKTAFDAATELVIQKAFLDHMWTIPLVDMIDMIRDLPERDSLSLGDIAARVDDGIAEHADQIRSFEQVWSDELRGVTDLFGDVGAEVISDLAEAHGDPPLVRDTANWRECRNVVANLLFHALKTKPEVRRQLPTLYVEASLHAVFRWNKQRRMKGNDLYDIQHASAALGYMDVFLTEHSLRSDIMSKNLALDVFFECKVESTVAGALTILHTIERL